MLPPRAYKFIALNIARALSIIALLLVFSSNIVVIVDDIHAVNQFQQSSNATSLVTCDYIAGSTVPDQPAGVFWAVVNRLLIIVQVLILILSEIGWPNVFFERFFPVLGPSFGLGALGVFQCLIGATILSHHTNPFTLVSAFFLFSIGCLNMLLGLIFRESAKAKRSILSWREQAKAVLPINIDKRPFNGQPPSFASSVFNSPAGGNKHMEEAATWKSGESGYGLGFGRQGEKAAGLKGFLISKPLESLPRYAAKPSSTRSSNPSRASSPVFTSSGTAI